MELMARCNIKDNSMEHSLFRKTTSSTASQEIPTFDGNQSFTRAHHLSESQAR